MRRKDGRPKIRSPKRLPEYERGLRSAQAFAGTLSPEPKRPYEVVSLFSGCGGMDLGFVGDFSVLGQRYPRLPFRVRYASDNLHDAVDAYRLNLGDEMRHVDLTTIPAADLPRTDVLTGGFPCQDFSSSGPKVGLAGTRGMLYRVLVDYMSVHQPSIVVGENVPHLARMSGGRTMERIVGDLEGIGYRFQIWSLSGPDYGLPQSRRRLILVGVREDLPGSPRKPRPTHENHHVPVDVALADLESIIDESVTNQSQYFLASRATAGGGQGDHTNERGKVAYCIRANARGRIQFHYELDRRLTVRECARLQSFPDEFVFPFTTQRNLTLIGNAVPPILGHAVASSIADYLRWLETPDQPPDHTHTYVDV